MLARALRTDAPLVLVAADRDHFKAINGGFGHAAGDTVIAHFASPLRGMASGAAIVSRLGGEEFAVLLPNANIADGRRYAESVRTELAAVPLSGLGIHPRVPASVDRKSVVSGKGVSVRVVLGGRRIITKK